MRLEEFLGHRRGDTVAEPRRESGQDDRRIHVALVVRGEDHGSANSLQVLAAVDPNPREQAGDRQDPGRQAGAADGARRPGPVPRRKFDRLEGCRAGLSALDDRAQGRQIARFGERVFVDARAEGILQRHHQLDPFQRAQAKLLERGRRREIGAARVLGDERRQDDRRRRPSAAPARRSSTTGRSRPASTCRCLRCEEELASGQATARRIF